jgi:hypothetical protein
VVLVWRGEPLEERVFSKPQTITVGSTKRDTFTVPPSRVGESFPLFRSSDSAGFMLTLARGMSGKLSIGGEPWAVSEFIRSGRGIPTGDHLEQPLATSDWGIVSLDESGDVAFFFQFISKGLHIGPHQSWLDRFFGQALGFSAIVHVALLILAFLAWEPTDALDIDPPPTTAIAKLILEKPPEDKPEEKKKPGGGDDPRKRREEDTSKRAAGKEGKIGNPENKGETKIPKGPKDQVVAKVSNMGLLGTLKQQKSGALKMLLSDTPDATVTTAMAGLKGTELVVGKGSGGMSTRGEGPGGGGTGKGQILGVGNLAIGGGGHGKPGGGGGTGGGWGGGHGAKEMKVAVDTSNPDTSGGLSREQILKVVMAHKAAISFCYEKELLRFPHLSGTVNLFWKVDLEGHVETVKVEKSSLNNPSAESCMARQVKMWLFPKPNGIQALVNFPFTFRSQ